MLYLKHVRVMFYIVQLKRAPRRHRQLVIGSFFLCQLWKGFLKISNGGRGGFSLIQFHSRIGLNQLIATWLITIFCTFASISIGIALNSSWIGCGWLWDPAGCFRGRRSTCGKKKKETKKNIWCNHRWSSEIGNHFGKKSSPRTDSEFIAFPLQ